MPSPLTWLLLRLGRARLRRLGYVRIKHGVSCGRHWVEIDGKMIYQASGADLWMPDDFTQALAIVADPTCEWGIPCGWKSLNEGERRMPSPLTPEVIAELRRRRDAARECFECAGVNPDGSMTVYCELRAYAEGIDATSDALLSLAERALERHAHLCTSEWTDRGRHHPECLMGELQ